MRRYITGWDDPARTTKLQALARALPPDMGALVEQLAKAETPEAYEQTRLSLRAQFAQARRYWFEPLQGKTLALTVLELFPGSKPEKVVKLQARTTGGKP